MDAGQIREDVRAGRIDVDRLIGLIVASQRQLQRTQRQLQDAQRQLQQANERIAELERKLGGSAAAKLSESYSMQAEERRQEARGRKRRRRDRPKRGRRTTAEKVARAERVEQVFPAGAAPEECRLSHTRPVWRLENGRAVLVAYEVYRGPKNRFGRIPGVHGRSEFGIEIVVAIAYQVYVVGLSFDKVCLLMNFFQNLPLRKSQVDALLNQVARQWEVEFERLCILLANSAVVHADETSWSIRSVWAFLSETARVLLFGVPKDGRTLETMLPPAFAGIVVSDDAAVYANFTRAQKCWAHLLRKAIRLTLLEPENEEYRQFADRLLEIYRTACRLQRDRRFSEAGRAMRAAALDDRILDLCDAVWSAELPPLEGAADDYRLLCNELMRLLLADELFTFVTAAPVTTPAGRKTPVAGTNNEAERTLRGAAEARKTGRTSKTPRGARRQTIVVSVLQSLRQYLSTYTLASVVAEIRRWSEDGQSCFARWQVKLGLPPPGSSILDQLLPLPDG